MQLTRALLSLSSGEFNGPEDVNLWEKRLERLESQVEKAELSRFDVFGTASLVHPLPPSLSSTTLAGVESLSSFATAMLKRSRLPNPWTFPLSAIRRPTPIAASECLCLLSPATSRRTLT